MSSVTILLLDDEPLLRRATSLILSRHGGRVTSAASADEAIALAERRIYDVAVLDVSPPGPSATELLRRFRAGGLAPRRVIAICGAPLRPREAEAFTEVLVKPYRFESLLRAVFGAGGRRRTRSGVFACEPPAELTAPGSRSAERAPQGRGG
jgi:CheY-like chemotaxis protein